MKTIFKNGTYERVSDEVGDFKVRNQGYKFVPKKAWKISVRDIVVEAPKETEVVIEKKKYQKPKKS